MFCYHRNKKEGYINYACLGKKKSNTLVIIVQKCDSIIVLFYQHKENKNSRTKQVQNYYCILVWL